MTENPRDSETVTHAAGQLLGICSYVKIIPINVTVFRFRCLNSRAESRWTGAAWNTQWVAGRFRSRPAGSFTGELKGKLYGTVARATG